VVDDVDPNCGGDRNHENRRVVAFEDRHATRARVRATRCVVTGRAKAECDRSMNRGFKNTAHRRVPPPRPEWVFRPTPRPPPSPKTEPTGWVPPRGGARVEPWRASRSAKVVTARLLVPYEEVGAVSAAVVKRPQRSTLKWIVSFW